MASGRPWATGDVAHQLQVAGAVLLVTEGGEDEGARGIVDRAHEREPRTPALEPVVAGSVDLHEHARAGHALAAGAVARGPSWSCTGDARLTQDALHAGPGQDDALALREQLGEVTVVGAAIGVAPRELGHPIAKRPLDPVRADAATVAMGKGRGTLLEEAGPQAPGLALRDAQPGCGLFDGQVTFDEVGQDAALVVALRWSS